MGYNIVFIAAADKAGTPTVATPTVLPMTAGVRNAYYHHTYVMIDLAPDVQTPSAHPSTADTQESVLF